MKRRDFLKTTSAGAVALVTPPSLIAAAFAGQSGSQMRLGIVRRTIEVNGKAASVFGLRQENGLSGLRLRARTDFNVLLRNFHCHHLYHMATGMMSTVADRA